MNDFPRSHYRSIILALCCSTAALSACATEPPPEPSFAIMPAQGEGFSVFQQHDMTCRAYAANTSAGMDGHPKAVASAAVGAGFGAATGALLGNASGHAGNGAAIGAGSGLLLGSVLGHARQAKAAELVQSRYDTAYAQCMIADGEHLPAPPQRLVYGPPVAVYGPLPSGYAPYPTG